MHFQMPSPPQLSLLQYMNGSLKGPFFPPAHATYSLSKTPSQSSAQILIVAMSTPSSPYIAYSSTSMMWTAGFTKTSEHIYQTIGYSL